MIHVHSGRLVEVDVDVLKAAYRRRSEIDYTVFSRATWMLSHYSRNTFERIRQGMEIWGLGTT